MRSPLPLLAAAGSAQGRLAQVLPPVVAAGLPVTLVPSFWAQLELRPEALSDI